jgi:Ca-activated chloride channel family protein
MKNRFRAFLLFGLLIAGFAGAVYYAPDAEAQSTSGVKPTPTPPDPEEEEIRIDTEVVNILFTAQDKDRRLLLGLKKEDIRILEDGKAQEVVAFTRQVDLPLSLAILIDTSISQERTLPEEKMAAISFLESFIRPEKDEVAVVSFTGESTLEQGMTSNLQRLRRAIDRVKFVAPAGYLGGGVMAPTPPISGTGTQVAGSTAIWDSIWVTAEDVLGPAPERTRRAIILLSDGYNTSGRKKLEEAVLAAQKSEAVIYSIGIGDNFYSGVDEGALKKISERTGGRAFFPRNERQLREAFKQIEDEMRSQYLLAYEPTNPALDGSYRRIQIQVANPELDKQKVRLTHREGYFAKDQKNKK